MIYVCSLAEMPRHVRALRPAYVFSLVRDDEQPETPPEIDASRHLRIAIDDISEPTEGCTLPSEHHVGGLSGPGVDQKSTSRTRACCSTASPASAGRRRPR